MRETDLQLLCEQGQRELMGMNYLGAAELLEEAERIAWGSHDWDTLSRLYMPLQEAHRQKRQLCGEGQIALDLIAQSESDQIKAERIIENYPSGQLLIAGWCSIAPAVEFRKLARERKLYVETFLAAVYPAGSGKLIAIVPTEDVSLPGGEGLS